MSRRRLRVALWFTKRKERHMRGEIAYQAGLFWDALTSAGVGFIMMLLLPLLYPLGLVLAMFHSYRDPSAHIQHVRDVDGIRRKLKRL